MAMKAFVTGGGTGIGKQVALGLLENGYDVAVSYLCSAEGVEEVKEAGKRLGREVLTIKADISEISKIYRMFDEYEKMFGELDLFVNNAGVTRKSTFLETTEELFESICKIDYKGAFFCIQQAAKLMVKKGTKGNIVLISSNNAIAHFADVSVYGSAKAAAQKLAEHAAIELAQYGIRVNTISPGWTNTCASRLDAKESTYYKIPLRKWVEPQEIADAVLYLAVKGVSITGANLVIDNGALLVSDKCERYGF